MFFCITVIFAVLLNPYMLIGFLPFHSTSIEEPTSSGQPCEIEMSSFPSGSRPRIPTKNRTPPNNLSDFPATSADAPDYSYWAFDVLDIVVPNFNLETFVNVSWEIYRNAGEHLKNIKIAEILQDLEDTQLENDEYIRNEKIKLAKECGTDQNSFVRRLEEEKIGCLVKYSVVKKEKTNELMRYARMVDEVVEQLINSNQA